MKLNLKAVCASVAFCGVLFSAGAQINLLSDVYLGNALFSNSINNTGLFYNWGQFYSWGQASFYNGLSVYSGTKNFIHPHPTDTTKAIKYICIEAGESMTMVRGVSKTNGGSVEISLPEHFGLVTSTSVPLTVIITPEGAPVLLYTSKKTKEMITVAMKPADFKEFGDVQFAWQVSGTRDGYENEEIIVDTESFISGKPSSGKVSEKREKMNKWAEKLVAKQKVMLEKK